MRTLIGFYRVGVFAIFGLVGCDHSHRSANPVDPPRVAEVIVVLVDSSTVIERTRMRIADPAVVTDFTAAIERLVLSADGIPLSQAGDMKAAEMTVSVVDDAGASSEYALYWGDTDSGVIIREDRVHEVSSGLLRVRELVSRATGLGPYGRIEDDDGKADAEGH